MFRSIKFSFTVGAAILVAAPGCCLPNLLCSHASSSEEIIIGDYAGEIVDDYSVVSSDCGCSCDAGGVGVAGPGVASEVGAMELSIEDDGDEISSFDIDTYPSVAQPTPADSQKLEVADAQKVADAVQPPAALEKPDEKSLPSNFLP